MSLSRGFGKVIQEAVANPGSAQNIFDITSTFVILTAAGFGSVEYWRYFKRAKALPHKVKDDCWGASPIRNGPLAKIAQGLDVTEMDDISKPVLVWKSNTVEVWDVANLPSLKFQIPFDQITDAHFSRFSGDPELLGPFVARIRGVYVRLSITGFDVEGGIHFFDRGEEQLLITRFNG